MKKVITMVGTSLFTNYFKTTSDSRIRNYYEDLEESRDENYDKEKRRVSEIKREIGNFLRDNSEENISAEIKSLIKLKEELKDNFEIYLLYSDTVISHIAAELIKEFIQKNSQFERDEINIQRIDSLQVFDRKEFNKGMSNLITAIYSIAKGNWNEVIINITGGYKATIPYLTILAQLNNCPIYYIFEDTDALIKIPNIPFSQELFDWEGLIKYDKELHLLYNGIPNNRDATEMIRDFYERYSFLLWEDKELIGLNTIGEIVFKKYKEKIFVFFAPDEVWNKINQSENLLRLFKKKFSVENLRENKWEKKNGHSVYDDGDNQLRVFYRIRNENVYVYKVFDDHGEYERYLKNTPYADSIIEEHLSDYKRRVIFRNR